MSTLRAVLLGFLSFACGGAEPGDQHTSSNTPEPVSVAGSDGAPVEDVATAGVGGTGGTSAGASSADAGSGSAGLGGLAGQPGSAAGMAGQGSGGSSAGASGSAGMGGGSTVHPFACAKPEGAPADAEWKVYTVQSGDCLKVGNSTWSGQSVCTERSVTNGTCDVECWPYLDLYVRPGLEPVVIAVLPLFGTVSETSSDQAAPNYSPECY